MMSKKRPGRFRPGLRGSVFPNRVPGSVCSRHLLDSGRGVPLSTLASAIRCSLLANATDTIVGLGVVQEIYWDADHGCPQEPQRDGLRPELRASRSHLRGWRDRRHLHLQALMAPRHQGSGEDQAVSSYDRGRVQSPHGIVVRACDRFSA